MNKFLNFIKELRFEYKVVLIFLILLLISIPYSIIKKHSVQHVIAGGSGSSYSSAGGETLSDMVERKEKPSSISEAVEAERPLILSESGNSQEEDGSLSQQMINEYPDVKGMELATNVKNPTVWIYSLNNGLRKDDLAEEYCKKLHSKGLMAQSVVIYDEKERANGKLVELGEARCM